MKFIKAKRMHLKNILITICLMFFLFVEAGAQNRGTGLRESPNATVTQTIGNSVITVSYGRPAIKGRTYFAADAQLAPSGQPWRTGANEATIMTFPVDVTIAGKDVKAGSYSLYTIPGDGEWSVIVSTNLAWGIPYKPSLDLVRSSTSDINKKASFEEWFKISFGNLAPDKADLVLHWGTTEVAIPISVKK